LDKDDLIVLDSFLDSRFDARLVFSFSGLAVGSTISALPFMVNSVEAGFQNLSGAFASAKSH